MMKNIRYKLLILSALSLMIVALYHCSVSSVPMEVLVPAEITINKNIEHVGIMNYSRSSDRNILLDLAESFLTRESIFADQIGAEFCIKGLAEKLNSSPRFTSVIIHGENLSHPGHKTLPRQLSWSRVNRICKKYRLDALIALEHFDSDIFLDKKIKTLKKKDEDDKVEKKYKLKLDIRVSSGWRIYNSKTQSIIDAEIYQDKKVWRASGKNFREAREDLPDKRDAINQAGYYSGIKYGERISPTWVRMSRSYYSKGSPELEEAKRYIKTGDWDNAIKLWKQLLETNDLELKGRAAYNLAFGAEIKGHLIKAYKLAQESYTKYGNKKAYHYMNHLRQRITDKEKLKEQLD